MQIMKYAVIQTAGTQYVVSEGDQIEVNKLGVADGEKIVFDQVLVVRSDAGLEIGSPFVSGVKVVGKIVKNFKGEKLDIFKFKAKSRYRRKMGYRASLTLVAIDKIDDGKTSPKTETAPTKTKSKS